MPRTKRLKQTPGAKRPKNRSHLNHDDPKHKRHLNTNSISPNTQTTTSTSKSRTIRRQYSQIKPNSSSSQPSTKPASQHYPQQANQQPKIPFDPRDNVLLVGEGDFSFTESLVRHFRVEKVVGTCFDQRMEVEGKYEGFKGRVRRLGLENDRAENGLDQNGDKGKDQEAEKGEEVWNGFEGEDEEATVDPGNLNVEESAKSSSPKLQTQDITILYGIDATKLSTTHKKALRPHGPFSKIVFNFPHVGGLSTDVNRQVRSNQQLLVGFFESAKKLLATKESPLKIRHEQQQHQHQQHQDEDEEGNSYDSEDSNDEFDSDPDLTPNAPSQALPSQILLTLFEGEPYTLWNPRDLARHSGLRVVESFRFPWSSYPGYEHARTIGDVATGRARSEDGKRKGRWRGEEREARCFVLEIKEETGAEGGRGDSGEGANGVGLGKKRKRGKGGVGGGESDDSD